MKIHSIQYQMNIQGIGIISQVIHRIVINAMSNT